MSGSAARISSCSPGRRSAGGACAGSCRGPTWPARRACRGSARRSSPSTPRGSSRCRAAATGSSPAGCGRATGPARGPSRNATRRSSGAATARPRAASSSSCRTTSCPTTTGSWRSRRRWPRRSACRSSSPTTSTTPGPRTASWRDVLTAIRHGRTLDTLGDLRRPDGESYLKSGAELAALPPGVARGVAAARAWAAGISTAVELAASCSVDLGFEQYRFPGFPVPDGETPFSYLSELCWAGARKRYHPLTSAVVKRLAHELDVIERAGLAEFFLICWDLMRFAKEQGIPAQGRGSATSSIVSYTLGISRVEPIAHNLLFERFINPGRTTYPDVDIDFSSERREEVIQYVYKRYGPEHTGMVCNLVTYRARSAVREVGYALGFPRPLVDRVAKALETYDSVMVRRDLEADGGFAEFFRRPGEGLPAEESLRTGAAQAAEALGFVDGMGQLNTRMPLVGKVPPWRQPPKPEDPNAPRPFAWLRESSAGQEGGQTAEQGSAGQGADEHARGPAGGIDPAALTDPMLLPPADRGLDGRYAPSETPMHAHEGDPTARRRVPDGAYDRASPEYAGGSSTRGPNVASGLPHSLAPVTGLRPGGRADDEGGPGDTPASVAWLRAGRGTGYQADRDRLLPPALVAGRALDPESGMPESPPRATEGRATDRLGRPSRWDPPAPRRADQGAAAAHSSVARIEPEPPPQARGGSTVGLSRLGALARVLRPDRRLPAPPLDPLGRDARDRRAAHRHRPDRAGHDGRPGRRPVRQARRRDAQAHQARPARARDARRDGRDAPAHRARLRGLPRPRPPARGRPGGLRDAPGGRHGRGLPGREPGPDADAPEVAAAEPRRPRRRGGDHPARPDPGQRRPPVPAPQAGPRAGDLPPPLPRAGPQGFDGRDPLPGAGHAHRHRGRGLLGGRIGRLPAGDGDVALEPRDGEAPPAVRRWLPAPARA